VSVCCDRTVHEKSTCRSRSLDRLDVQDLTAGTGKLKWFIMLLWSTPDITEQDIGVTHPAEIPMVPKR
jgi:hypothetical protein